MSLQIAKYLELGWKIVRLHGVTADGECTCFKKNKCPTPGKHPFYNDWQNNASDNEEVILGWYEDQPNTNIGLLLGPKSGVIDVELDGEDAREAWTSLGLGEIYTPTYTSGRGPHRLFKWQDGLPTQAVKKVMGIEIRLGNGGRAGQSVIPPSRHATGTKYAWVNGLSPEDVEVAPLPEKLLRLLWNDDGSGIEFEDKEPATAIIHKQVLSGGRNNALYRFACAEGFRCINIDSEHEQQDLLVKVRAVNKLQCVPPLSEDEVRALYRSAVQYVRRQNSANVPFDESMRDCEDFLHGKNKRAESAPKEKDWVKVFTVTGLEYKRARGATEGEPEWWPGEWQLTVVHSDPIEYRLYVPAWREYTASESGCITLSVGQYRSATKVAAAVLAATGVVMLDDEPGKWKRIWDGGGKKKPARGIKAKLLDTVTHEYPGSSSLRYVTLAGWLYDRLSQATEPSDDDAPDPTGRAAWRSDGTLWWNWTKVWEDIERNHRVLEGERLVLKRRLLARLGDGLKDFRHSEYRHSSGSRKSYVVWTRHEFSMLEQMYLEAPGSRRESE